MDFTEKKVRSDYKFYGKIINVRVDDALLPNGKPCKREVCEHVGGVGILPIDENRMVTLVRQYRYPYETTTLEIPAGKMDQGPEEALECGRRELEERYEEIGGEAMLRELAQLDPERAAKLHARDKKRVVRAYEVYLLTGKTMSEHDAETRARPPVFSITIPLKTLYRCRASPSHEHCSTW